MKMAENGGFEGDHLAVTEGPGFSQLLFPADEVVNLAVDSDQTFNYTRSSTYPTQIKPPKMLCFGNYDQTHGNGVEIGFSETAKKSAAACSESSSVSSTGTASINALPKSNNKRQKRSAPISSTATPPTQKTAKKTKSENPTSAGNGKVRPFDKTELQKVIYITRKEKLGERITALQQLVSPYGKTDTASVLHEAMGYIIFLQEQVQVLCSPYLQRLPPSLPVNGGEVKQEGRRSELRSRGLCLVPMEYTKHAGNSNGADFWSPAMANIYDASSPSAKY